MAAAVIVVGLGGHCFCSLFYCTLKDSKPFMWNLVRELLHPLLWIVLMCSNKQLLDEVEHDIINYQNRGLCYLLKPKAEVDNTDTRFW